MRTVPGHRSSLLPEPLVEAVAEVDRSGDDPSAREALAEALEAMAWDVADDALFQVFESVICEGAPLPDRAVHRIADRARWSRAYTTELLSRIGDGDCPNDPRDPGNTARAVEFRSIGTRRRFKRGP